MSNSQVNPEDLVDFEPFLGIEDIVPTLRKILTPDGYKEGERLMRNSALEQFFDAHETLKQQRQRRR